MIDREILIDRIRRLTLTDCKIIDGMIKEHQKWIKNSNQGKQADFSGMDLSNIQLTNMDLSRAIFHETNLSEAQFINCDLSRSCFIRANMEYFIGRNSIFDHSSFEDANLSGAKLNDARLNNTNLSKTNLSNADLNYASLKRSFSVQTNFCCSYLMYADFAGSCLRGANLTSAKLENTNFYSTDLSEATGLSQPGDILNKYFEFIDEGMICYKRFGLYREPNPSWMIKEGAFLEENVDDCRSNECGSGISVATLHWLYRHTSELPGRVWRCLIRNEDLSSVVVPYNFNGKIRAGRIVLLNIL